MVVSKSRVPPVFGHDETGKFGRKRVLVSEGMALAVGTNHLLAYFSRAVGVGGML